MSGQGCGWPGCETTAKGLLCGRHRATLPKRLRQAVPATASMLPDEVLAYIKQANAEEQAAAEREADLRRRQETLF